MIQVAIVAADLRYLHRLGNQLDGTRGVHCQTMANSWAAFFELLHLPQPPQVVLFETGRLPLAELTEQIKKLQKLLPEAQFMALSQDFQLDQIRSLLRAGVNAIGARGEDAEEMVQAIRALHMHGAYLHPLCCLELFRNLREAGAEEPSAALLAAPPFKQLSFREQEIVRALSKGLEYKEVAAGFNISLNTVRHHVKSIYRKLGIQKKVELLNLIRENKYSSH